ncbi:MAG: hypothetical protein ACOCXT_02495 [Candidatus Dojkabacteria bacterium]
MKSSLIYCTIFVLLLSGAVVYAESQVINSEMNNSVSGRGTILTPTIEFLQGDRGEIITSSFTVSNDFPEKQEIALYPVSANTLQNPDGEPTIDYADRSKENDFASWFSVVDVIALEHQQSKTISYSVQIPENANSGTYSALILFPTTEINDISNDILGTGVTDRLGLPVFLTVKGDISLDTGASMRITDLAGQDKSNFFFGIEQTQITVQNTGNVFVKPYGDVFIYKDSLAEPVATIPFNEENKLVHSQSDRTFMFDFSTSEFVKQELAEDGTISNKIQWNKFFDMRFGRHKVTYKAMIIPADENVEVANAPMIFEETAEFFIFPVQLPLLLVLSIIIGGLFLTFRILKSKKTKSGNKKL